MFKEYFKYYKSKKPKPNLEKVFDCNKSLYGYQVERLNIKYHEKHFSLKQPDTWELYEFKNKPGLIYLKNPFTSIGQRYWTVRCLRDYSKKPNRRNIDALNVLSDDEDWWDLAQNSKNMLCKLRWATIGYHHNWDTKIYSEDNKGEFPEDLANLTCTIAHNLGLSDYISQAAIINYYHMDSILSGHTDHSEKNLTAPLFSFSFGQTAIFLLGGKTIEEEPLAIFLKSGDIVVMSEESRLCYHGVPRILEAPDETWNSFDNETCSVNNEAVNICKNQKLWEPYGQYLNHCRINMNVRQVLHKNQKCLTDNL